MTPRVALVAAVARNGVIGRDGDLPWRISDDLKWFKRVTLGKPIVMGRKTFDSLPRALPGRFNVVVSRNPPTASPGGPIGASSIEGALALSRALARAAGADDVCVIGGAAIYAATLDIADRIYLTAVDGSPAGDAFFPNIDLEAGGVWRRERVGAAAAGPKNDYGCEFFILDRVKSAA